MNVCIILVGRLIIIILFFVHLGNHYDKGNPLAERSNDKRN